MNILIVTPFYKQDKNIASVRWTNLSARLSKKHNIIVVTQPFDDMDMNVSISKEDNILVARVNQKTGYEKLAVKHFNGATGNDWQTGDMNTNSAPNDTFIRRLKNKVMFASMKRKSKQYASYIVKNVIPKNTKIDVVISSACPFIEMLFGYELKKKLKCKWISDFRDLPFMEDNSDVTHRERNIMEKCLFHSDAVTVVALIMKKLMCKFIEIDENKIHLITNGFSTKESRETSKKDDNILHITHTGSLYGGRRRADLLFSALKKIKEKNSDYKFVLDCAGGNNSTIIDTAKKYGCIDMVKDYGFLSREDALSLQTSSDCLLLMAEPYALPAKLYEYILNKKPIICITVGDEDYSESTDLMNKLNLGIAVEERNWNNDVDRLTDYLISQNELKTNGKKLIYNPNKEEIAKYDHDYLAQKVEDIVYSLIN